MTFKIRVLMFTAICNFLFGKTAADAQPINLAADSWRFKMDDNPAYAERRFDDSMWQRLAVGQPWELALGNVDGTGWYRKTVVVDSKTYRAAVRKGKGMVLRLGKIDDADETFFNGTRIGGMGKFPPETITAWDEDRAYIVPKELIRFHSPNVISVRVVDWGGGGGMYAGEYTLEPITWKERLKMTVENAEITQSF